MKKRIAYITISIFSVTLIYSSYQLIRWQLDNNKTNKVANNIKIISHEEIKEDNTISIDFNNLLLENKEVVGWLKVNGTSIDYPVVKHNNNDYYLNHSFDGKSNTAGWIFMDTRNNHNNLDFNTIIYGHGRRDGSMFGSLFKTLNKDWIQNKDNLTINFTTLNHSYLFQIFSIYYIDTTDDYININYNQELLKRIINRSIYSFNTDVTLDDKILTLSTCYNNEKKLVLHAKLVYSN